MDFSENFNYKEFLYKEETENSKDIFHDLLTKGYFPTEITPWFNTVQLSKIASMLKDSNKNCSQLLYIFWYT